MHCSHCGAILFDASTYCGNCGTLIETQPAPETVHLEAGMEPNGQASDSLPASVPSVQPEQPPVSAEPTMLMASSPIQPEQPLALQETPPLVSSPSLPPPPALFAPPAPAGAGPSMASGWAEFSGVQLPPPGGLPAGSSTYPSPLPAPGSYAPGYMAPGTYPNYTPNYASNLVPLTPMSPAIMPVQQAPGRRWPVFILGMIVGVLLTLVSGSLVVGLRVGQTQNNIASVPVNAVATPVVTPTTDANLLYQQVTSQPPTYVDSLQDTATSLWGTIDKPTYGCAIQSDGLHIRISDTRRFYYCTSGHGGFVNFAFQVEMNMLTGGGGGVTFRGNTLAGNFYYFHVFPDGSYEVNIEQNHKFGSILTGGTASVSPIKSGVKTLLTVIAQGSEIYLYLNRTLIKQFQDSTYTSGYIGVVADDHDAPAEVVYTNAQIWML